MLEIKKTGSWFQFYLFLLGPRFQLKKKKKVSPIAATSSENVMFTITKHVEQEEVQPYLVRFQNGDGQQQGARQQVRQLQVMKGKLPTSMQLLKPQTTSTAPPQPRLEAGQIMTLRRPDGTLVQVVAQRSRQQQQQILAPKLPGQVFKKILKCCHHRGMDLKFIFYRDSHFHN